ncbi:hypothetical protein [Streptomyces tubercidicus]|uniref:hypothetical protein n=1 Tax=Streptomyces tubercidicus TaxID=47759 RepID=UPI0037B83C22
MPSSFIWKVMTLPWNFASRGAKNVEVELDATQTDGTHRHFAGTYTVRDGVIVAARIHRE